MLVFPKPAALVLLAALSANLIARGIVPAMSSVQSDFPSYFTAARIVADGGDAERLYDIPWFQEQMRRYQIGKPSAGKFSPFPPPTALLLVPVARLAPRDALRVVTVVSVLSLIGSIFLLARILAWSALDTALLVLLSGWAVLAGLRLGQPYILVSASCILGYHAYLKDRPWLAGASLGLFTPLKYFPVVILGYLGLWRRWQVLAGGALAIALVSGLSIAVLGWKIHAQFLGSVLGNHLIAKLNMQDPFTAHFQSFDTLFRRLFVFDATANPQPLHAAPLLQSACVLVTKTAILLAAIGTLVRLARARGASATAPSIGLLGITTLLLAPATASYHMVLLWLPMGLFTDFLLRERAVGCAYFLLGGYALIGFFPFAVTAPFEGRGGLTVLAYPRLFLLLSMFLACVLCLWRRAGRSQQSDTLPAPDYGREKHDGP
jgi:Glycosyltransferase family 87